MIGPLAFTLKPNAPRPPRVMAFRSKTPNIYWLKGWVEKGTRLAVLTQGPEDVLAVSIEGFWRAVPPKIQAVNPIGAATAFWQV